MSKIKELRNERELSLRQLSDLTGIHRGNLSNLEHGKIKLKNMSFENIIKLSKALNVSLDDLASIDE